MNNVIKIVLDSKIYNLEAILNTSYTFIDRAYIYLDYNDKKGKKIIVSLKGKQKLSAEKIKQLEGEFMNGLLHNTLRFTINKNNRKIREYIVGRALYSALPESESIFIDNKLDYPKDPLGIAIPWEEKYGKKRKNAKAKV